MQINYLLYLWLNKIERGNQPFICLIYLFKSILFAFLDVFLLTLLQLVLQNRDLGEIYGIYSPKYTTE